MKNVRYCFGEKVHVYEITGESFTELLKRTKKAVEKWEENDDYSWFQFQTTPNLDNLGNFTIMVYAHL